MTEFLTLESALHIAQSAIEGEVQVRDMGLLESAVARPRTSLFGEDAYPGLTDKAAALLSSLTNNHALVDGNKRLAWQATAVFLWIDGVDVTADDDAIFALVMDIAGGSVAVDEIAARLEAMTGPR